MPNVEKVSIALPPEMANLLREAVDSGEYASTSEVVRDALRAWKLRRELQALEISQLRGLVQEGIESGPEVDAARVFSRLRSKYRGARKAK